MQTDPDGDTPAPWRDRGELDRLAVLMAAKIRDLRLELNAFEKAPGRRAASGAAAVAPPAEAPRPRGALTRIKSRLSPRRSDSGPDGGGRRL